MGDPGSSTPAQVGGVSPWIGRGMGEKMSPRASKAGDEWWMPNTQGVWGGGGQRVLSVQLGWEVRTGVQTQSQKPVA